MQEELRAACRIGRYQSTNDTLSAEFA